MKSILNTQAVQAYAEIAAAGAVGAEYENAAFAALLTAHERFEQIQSGLLIDLAISIDLPGDDLERRLVIFIIQAAGGPRGDAELEKFVAAVAAFRKRDAAAAKAAGYDFE